MSDVMVLDLLVQELDGNSDCFLFPSFVVAKSNSIGALKHDFELLSYAYL